MIAHMSIKRVFGQFLSENTANSGGGLDDAVGDVIILTDCTVSDNSGTSGGGGFELSGTATLTNTIVAGNIDSSAPATSTDPGPFRDRTISSASADRGG